MGWTGLTPLKRCSATGSGAARAPPSASASRPATAPACPRVRARAREAGGVCCDAAGAAGEGVLSILTLPGCAPNRMVSIAGLSTPYAPFHACSAGAELGVHTTRTRSAAPMCLCATLPLHAPSPSLRRRRGGGVHHPPRHAVWCHLHGGGTRAPAAAPAGQRRAGAGRRGGGAGVGRQWHSCPGGRAAGAGTGCTHATCACGSCGRGQARPRAGRACILQLRRARRCRGLCQPPPATICRPQRWPRTWRRLLRRATLSGPSSPSTRAACSQVGLAGCRLRAARSAERQDRWAGLVWPALGSNAPGPAGPAQPGRWLLILLPAPAPSAPTAAPPALLPARLVRRQPRQRRAHPHLGGRLCAGRVRQRRHHGCAGARHARPRVCPGAWWW